MARIPVALQLYTVRDEAAKDFIGTLRKVAAIGYAGVEMAGVPPSLTAREVKQTLDDLGLRCVGAHTGLEQLEQHLPRVIEDNLELGNRYLVIPWIPDSMRADEAACHETVRRLNAIGRTCREHGLTLAYHNHDVEFKRVGGRYVLEILYDETDPALVKGEPDVYWIARAGEDPAAWLRRYPGRCPLVHLKDMTPAPERGFAEIGEGIIDFAPIFAACEAGGTEWYIVEQDRCARPTLESAALSLQHLREWGIA
ncbi:MAG: sugar phosphate isomerase/epimerase [Anaerolineae bacterium]|nr:sugar phosphate isomerase/epimerase [Anaerolineae bacterium]